MHPMRERRWLKDTQEEDDVRLSDKLSLTAAMNITLENRGRQTNSLLTSTSKRSYVAQRRRKYSGERARDMKWQTGTYNSTQTKVWDSQPGWILSHNAGPNHQILKLAISHVGTDCRNHWGIVILWSLELVGYSWTPVSLLDFWLSAPERLLIDAGSSGFNIIDWA